MAWRAYALQPSKGWAESLRRGRLQEAKRHVESEAAHLRAQLTAASHVLADSAGEIKELKVCKARAAHAALPSTQLTIFPLGTGRAHVHAGLPF